MNIKHLINAGYANPLDPLGKDLTDLALQYQARYGDPRCGYSRMTFFDKDFVYKVPRNSRGFDDNEREAAWKDDFIPLADCSLKVEMPSGIPVLKMERVSPTVLKTEPPEWVMWVDCAQIGYTKDGRLVAYDL